MNEQLETLIAELIAAIPRATRRVADFGREATFKDESESWNDVEEDLLLEQQKRNYLERGDVLVCGWFDRAAIVMVGRGDGKGRTCHIVALNPKGVVIHKAHDLGPSNPELTAVFAKSPQNCAGLRNIIEYFQGVAV